MTLIKKKSYIKAFTNINGLVCHTFLMAKNTGAVPQVNSLAYPSGKVTLKKAKLEDHNKLKEFIYEEFNEFYNIYEEFNEFENILQNSIPKDIRSFF